MGAFMAGRMAGLASPPAAQRGYIPVESGSRRAQDRNILAANQVHIDRFATMGPKPLGQRLDRLGDKGASGAFDASGQHEASS